MLYYVIYSMLYSTYILHMLCIDMILSMYIINTCIKLMLFSLKQMGPQLGSFRPAPLFASFGQNGTASHHPCPIGMRPCEAEKRPEHGHRLNAS